jgi:ABC-type sugar transport system ATPase subunit
LQLNSSNAPVIEAKRVSKTFGHVQALCDANFRVDPHETVAVVGDNGAGKSTLMKILAGAEQPDEGTIGINGHEVELASPRDARRAGVSVVYQDLALVDSLDVATNVFLGRAPKRRFVVDRKRMARETTTVLSELGINVPAAHTLVGLLSGGQRQAVAIARAVHAGGQLMIMDEPTAALGVQEAQKVLKVVEMLKSQGRALVIVSHNLEHVFALADRIVVLRGGRIVGSRRRTETTHSEIVHMIVGAIPTQG